MDRLMDCTMDSTKGQSMGSIEDTTLHLGIQEGNLKIVKYLINIVPI